jgi:hypothetical protein
MLKLPFIHQSQQVKTAIPGNKEIAVLEIPKLLREQLKTLLGFCTEAVNMTWAIADQTEIRLLNIYNSLTYFESEPLDSHRGSGRIENRSSVNVFFSVVKNELVPGWVIA